MNKELALLLEKQSVPPVLLLPSRYPAKELALLLMGERHREKLLGGQHPDLFIYQPEGKSGLHPIESMRELIAETSLPPYEAKYKIFLIEGADRMAEASANCLLKTLEEPPQHCYIFLLTDKSDALLPTITSRCRKISSPEEEVRPLSSLLQEILSQPLPLPELSKKLSELEESLPEEGSHTVVESLLSQILETYRDCLHSQPEALGRIFDAIEECRSAVQQNVKLRTCLEWFFQNYAICFDANPS